MIERETDGERAAPRMANDDRAFDAKLIQYVVQDPGLIARRTAVAALAFAPAHSGPVDHNDASPRCQALAERQPHVFKIDAGSVDENDRRRIVRCGA